MDEVENDRICHILEPQRRSSSCNSRGQMDVVGVVQLYSGPICSGSGVLQRSAFEHGNWTILSHDFYYHLSCCHTSAHDECGDARDRFRNAVELLFLLGTGQRCRNRYSFDLAGVVMVGKKCDSEQSESERRLSHDAEENNESQDEEKRRGVGRQNGFFCIV